MSDNDVTLLLTVCAYFPREQRKKNLTKEIIRADRDIQKTNYIIEEVDKKVTDNNLLLHRQTVNN